MVNWLLDGVQVERLHVKHLRTGQNSIELSPEGVGDVARWSSPQDAVANGDVGMDATGHLQVYVGGESQRVPVESEIAWPQPVNLKSYRGNATVWWLSGNRSETAIEAVTLARIAFVVSSVDGDGLLSGIPCAVGDIFEYSGSAWVKIVANVGGFPPVGTVVLLWYAGVTAPYTEPTDRAKIAVFDGADLTAAAIHTVEVGDTVILNGSGSVDEGRTVEYSGTAWSIVIVDVSNFPPDGTRLLVDSAGPLVAPLSDSADNGKIALFDGTSFTPTFSTPTDGQGIIVKGENSVVENTQWVFDGSVPSGEWVCFAASVYLSDVRNVGKRCRVATTTNVADLATGAPRIVDGVTTIPNNRAFVGSQDDKSENGVYTIVQSGGGSNGTWVRATDADAATDFVPGLEVYIEEGTDNGLTTYRLTTTGTITLDTTDLEFVQGGPLVRSDGSPQALALDSATINQSDNFTAAIDCRDFPWANLLITWTGGTGSPAELHAKWQWSMDGSTWVDATTEAIASGNATQSPYDAHHDDVTAAASSRGFGVPTTGKRYWRANITCLADTLTTASASSQRGAQ